MDPLDRHLLSELENGLPLVKEPFEEIGKRLNLTGREVLERIRKLQTAGIIRKFRARINQRRVGISANALVAWKRVDSLHGDMGLLLASFPCVSHCYERLPVPGRWEYTVYTVHHGYSRDAVLAEIRTLAGHIGAQDYVVLFSTEEFKRVPNVRIRENGSNIV
ncbi:MAG: siroheme decarboxylase subunit beta [Methanoregula sp.]|uniref:siroheme decarboxylase subunit beta n=1 Tax=Methanoregula sp. TaxID=2052170 RepID=UPI003C1E192B